MNCIVCVLEAQYNESKWQLFGELLRKFVFICDFILKNGFSLQN